MTLDEAKNITIGSTIWYLDGYYGVKYFSVIAIRYRRAYDSTILFQMIDDKWVKHESCFATQLEAFERLYPILNHRHAKYLRAVEDCQEILLALREGSEVPKRLQQFGTVAQR